jgi:hypothetical protein
MDPLASIKAFVRDRVEPRRGTTLGATEAEVAAFERMLGKPVPAAYRSYLLWMGQDVQGVLRGSDCFLSHVVDNNAYLPELLAENEVTFHLPASFVCFFMHQGYIAAWFDLDSADDDPPCWVFAEGSTPQPKLDGTFASFISGQIRGIAESWLTRCS